MPVTTAGLAGRAMVVSIVAWVYITCNTKVNHHLGC